MTTRRLFAPLPPEGGELTLDAASTQHAKVLRLQAGDEVTLFDGLGGQARATVTAVDERSVRCGAGPREAAPGSEPPIVLVQCVPKGSKLDIIVRMATEVGVCSIHLAAAERSVARPEGARAAARLSRLRRVAQEAARQAGRATVPEIAFPAPLLEVVARAPSEATRLVLSPDAQPASVAVHAGEQAWLVVGPEGGLSQAESDALTDAGWRPLRLGQATMRVETAAPVAVAVVMDRLRGDR